MHAPAAGALPLAWKGLVAISGGTAEATNGFVVETAGHKGREGECFFVFFCTQMDRILEEPRAEK